MKIKDIKFKTTTCTICESNRLERLYDGPVENIPKFVKNYNVSHVTINPYIDNTYVEAY